MMQNNPQQLLDALKLVQGLPAGTLGPGMLLSQSPDLALLSQLQLLGGTNMALGMLGSQPAGLSLEEPVQQQERRGRVAKPTDSRSSSAYASRHQAAEQRRRTRINER